MTSLVGAVTRAVRHPLSTAAWTAGLVRGFAASMIQVAAGKQGPVVPGYLPGPVAAPVEEDVRHEDVTPLIHLDPPNDDREDEPGR